MKDLPFARGRGLADAGEPTTCLGSDFGRSRRGLQKTGKKRLECRTVLCSRHICQFRSLLSDRCGSERVRWCGQSLRVVLWLALC